MIDLQNLINEIQEELDYDYDDLLEPVTHEYVARDLAYRKITKTVEEAKCFNYHSDYWGDADHYQDQNVRAMRMLKPYIGKEVMYQGQKVKLVAMLIDKQYNSIGHTALYIEEIKEGDNK